LPSKPEDIKKLKKTITTEINEFSPETLKIFSDMVSVIKSLEASLTIQKKSKKK
jgi:hypothetical protein